MSLDPITAGLELANTLGKIAVDAMDKSQRERLDESKRACEKDIEKFKCDILDDRIDDVLLELDGLCVSIGVSCTADQRRTLIEKQFKFNGYSLLGFYARGRTTVHFREVIDILTTQKDK